MGIDPLHTGERKSFFARMRVDTRPFKHRDFRNLWLGQAASGLGDRMIVVALAIYVTDVGSPSDVGVVLAAHSTPFIALLLIGGVWADRLPRHRLMIATDAVRFALHALLAVLIFAGEPPVWQIAAIEALFGAAMAFFRPAYTGLLPQTVPEQDIQAAQALTGVTNTVFQFIGPAVATALVLGLGAGWAFALDALTFAVSAAFLLRVTPRPRGEAAARTSMLREVGEGWRAVRERDWVMAIVGAASLIVLLVLGPLTTLGPAAAEELHGEAGVYGLLMAAFGGGTLAGSILAVRWRPEHPLRVGQLLVWLYAASVAVFAAGAPLAVACVAFALGGFSVGVYMVFWETALAEHIPPHLLSRVGSFDWLGSMALVPVAYLLAGPLGESLGGPEVLLVGALAGTLVELCVLFVPGVWGLKSGTPASEVEASA
jgi:MFS family permease